MVEVQRHHEELVKIKEILTREKNFFFVECWMGIEEKDSCRTSPCMEMGPALR